MLAEWYFCCCISASLSDTEAFLSILETLENPESDNRLLYIAYEEIQYIEDRMQVYALPFVLRSLHRDNLPAGLKKKIRRYLNSLVDSIFQEVDERFQKVEEAVQQLINLALSDQPSASQIINSVSTFANSIFSKDIQSLPERQLTSTPYFNLKEFFPETIVLAILADQLEINQRLVDEFISQLESYDQDENSSPIRLFLLTALESQFGRLAFRFSVLIASLTSIESLDKVCSLLGKKEVSFAAEFEPDLLQTYANVLFSIKNIGQPAIVSKNIILESLKLSELRKLIQESSQASRGALDDLFLRVGIHITPNRTECLPIIYWQITLWQLAAQIDALTTANELAKFWHPSTSLPKYLNVSCSKTDINAQVKKQLQSLLDLQGLKGISLQVKTKTKFEIQNKYEYGWLFLSPWIYTNCYERKDGVIVSYPKADEPVLLLRLMGSVFVVDTLLRQLVSNNWSQVEFAACLLAHASDVMSTIEVLYRKDKAPQLSPALIGLFQSARRQVKLAGTGQFESIKPQIFVDICEKGQKVLQDNSKIPFQKKLFLKSILPKVLISWITDAYNSAVSDSLSGRWLSLIPDVAHLITRNHHNFQERQKAALVTRFLSPKHLPSHDDQLDWKIERTNIQNKWKVHHRKLLLTNRLNPDERLSPDDWIGVEWDNDNVTWGSNSKDISSNRLVYTLEFLDAIGHYTGYDIQPEALEQKFDEWKYYLNSVGQARYLDRFTRLRLLEFLDSPILQKRTEEQLLIASVLLEYGSAYEIKELFKRVYRVQEDGITFQVTTSDRQELQIELLQKISNCLEKDTSEQINHQSLGNDWNQDRDAQDPRTKQKNLQYFELCQELITKLLYLSSITENTEDFIELGDNLANLRRSSLERQANKTIRAKTVDVEIRNNQKLIIQSSNEQAIPYWAINAINYDPNRLKAKLFYKDFDTTGITNLFEKSHDEIRNFSHQTNFPVYVLAVVVNVAETESANHWKYTFDCGFEFLINYSSNHEFQIGDYVRLPIQQYQQGTKWWWGVSKNQNNQKISISLLRNKPLIGDISEVIVDETRKDSKNPFSLERQLDKQKELITNKVNLRFWYANISRNFCQHFKLIKRKVFARLDMQQGWIPIDLELRDLLSQKFYFQQRSNVIVLTLIEETSGEFGEKAWRFSYQPGENYLIEQQYFLGDNAEILANKIEMFKNCTDGALGLLVSVTPGFEAGQVGLRLATTNDVKANRFDKLYSDLRIPFDDRNIQWRGLFDRLEQLNERAIAEKDENGNWFFQIPDKVVIPGYPRQIKVEWADRRPARNKLTEDMINIRWYESLWRRPAVIAELPSYHRIIPQNRDWTAFLQRWLNLPEKKYIAAGPRIKLEFPLGWVDREGDGFIPCLTSEKLRVWVQAESLTMLPLKHRDAPWIGENREAEIFWIEWYDRKVRPDVKDVTIPPNAIKNNQCIGILTNVPDPKKGTQCQVIWQDSERKLEEQGIQIDNLDELRIDSGYKIIGEICNGKWMFHIKKPHIRARALWSLKHWKPGESNELYYLRVVISNDGKAEDLEVAESKSKPGELVCLPHRPQEDSPLAIGKENKSKELRFAANSLWEDNRTSNTSRLRYSSDELSFQYRRAILNLNGQLLVGHCEVGRSDSSVTVRGIRLLGTQREDNRYVLRRRFDLRPIQYIKRDIERQYTNSENNLWQRKLEDYLRKPPEPLKATFAKYKGKYGFWLTKGQEDEIRVPEDSNWSKWTLWVPQAPDQGTFIMEGNYSDQARICLLPAQGKIWASCRSVPPMTLEEFRVNYCEAPALNANVFLLQDKDIHLYYVAPEEVKNSKDETEIFHRFEMGYGETLLVPESQLEFDDGPFSKAQLSLFHGDLIKLISFKEKQIGDVDNEQFTQSILNIKLLIWSEAKQLYYQRTEYQIVHLLHLNISENQLKISYIDGFNENAISEKRKFETKKFHAYLTRESRDRLVNRHQKWLENEEKDPVILGRLDEERFRNSNGRSIYFEHVRLSFVESSKGSCLLNGDLVFLMADRIIELGKNDMALKLKPPRGLDIEDIGKDAVRLMVLRRSFSVRENLLKQVYETNGKDYFEDDLLLVKLFQRDKKSITSRLLLEGNKVPSRRASALIGAVKIRGSAGLLATIVKAEDQGSVQIEYKPGVFIRLKHYQIQERPDKLLKGTIVRIEVSKSYLCLTRAAFGDIHYVTQDIRPVVIFPTNNVRRIEQENWLSKSNFTIGGLPNIIALPGNYDNNQWRNSFNFEEINELMATNHPKIVSLEKISNENYKISPLSNKFPCGRLVRGDDSLSVHYESLKSQSRDSEIANLNWQLLSFGDESVTKIIERANAEQWIYHDNETFTWVSETQEFKVEKLRTRIHSVWTGPIFFQSHRRQLRLRYTQLEFRRFGFPVQELIYTLKQSGGSRFYPVAGISQSSEPSLWIELAPGRIVELPVQLIVWRSGVNNKPKSLANLMHWQGFAPGDQVELELVSTDPLIIDQVAMRNWIPGSRNAFGLACHNAIEPLRCFLPVLESPDEKKGEITLGCGEFKLKLPFAEEKNTNWRMGCLNPQNNCIEGIPTSSDTANYQPKRNDIVLLGIDDQDKITVLGFEKMTPSLDQKEAKTWKKHPITGCLVDQKQEKFFLVRNLIKEWINIAGGALPVTVEGCHKSQNQHYLFFSMRYQQDAALIPSGRISLARFVGLLPHRNTVILRCGGGLIPLPMRWIFPGLDKSLYQTAVEQLKQAQVSLWLRREKNGKFEVGFNDESRNQDILVKSLDILLQKNGGEEAGLICQSIDTSNLYWFPIQHATWTTLSVDEFRHVFQTRLFKVRQRGRGSSAYVSLLAVPDVYAESKKLIVGKELQVKVLDKTKTNINSKGEQRYLVESLATKVILDCEIYDEQLLQPGEVLSVEVVRHIKGKPELISVVPVGKKQKFLDLPTWMTEQLPDPGLRRPSIRNYIYWRQSKELIKSENDSSIPLDRLLCHYYNDAFGAYRKEAQNNETIEKQLKVAKEWEKQNRYKTEINAAFAIMAILLLDNHQETKREAYKLTQNLGLRALRSLHIEVLYQQWLSVQENRQRDDDLWQRLQQLETDEHLHIPLKEDSSYVIRQFCNSVEMRADRSLLPVAHALSAALGELKGIEELQKYSYLITSQLIDIYHTLPNQSDSSELRTFHINKLKDTLMLIDDQGLDITLLEPLSFTRVLESNSKTHEDYDAIAELFPQKQVEIDWESWIFYQIEHLGEFTENYIDLQRRTEDMKARFQQIELILEE